MDVTDAEDLGWWVEQTRADLGPVDILITNTGGPPAGGVFEMTDAEIIETIGTLCKQRRESIRLFKEAGRQELVDKEEAELALMMEFLPQQLTREELEVLVDKAIAETSATGGKDMGKVMKALMPSVTGRADGKLVSEVVKEKLA